MDFIISNMMFELGYFYGNGGGAGFKGDPLEIGYGAGMSWRYELEQMDNFKYTSSGYGQGGGGRFPRWLGNQYGG